MKGTMTGRRTFLKTTTAVAMGAVVVRPESVFGTPVNSAPEVGIIGCGGRGKYVGRFFYELTDAKIVALSDPFEDRLQETKSKFPKDNPQTYLGLDSYEELIHSDVDAVVITSPPYYHPEHAAAAVDAGKHVYMAKPVAVDVPGCLQIAETSRKAASKHLNFLVDFQTRSSPFFIEAAKRVNRGDLGPPVCGQIFYHTGRIGARKTQGMSPDQARLRNWVFDKVLSGDIIVEQNVHVLDVSNWYVGTHPLKAYGTGGRKGRTDVGDCWDHFIVVYWYPNGVKIDFSSSQFLVGFHDMCMRVYGTKGTVDSHYDGAVKITGKNPWNGTDRDNTFRDGAIANVKRFVTNIQNGKGFHNGDVAAESTLTGILGRMAAYEGRLVTWEEMIQKNERLQAELNL